MKHSWSKNLSCFKWPTLHLTRPDIGTPQTLNTGLSDNEKLLTKATPQSQLRVHLVSVAKPTPTRPTSGRPKIHKTGQHKCSVSSCNRTRNISQRLRCLSTFQTYPENFNVKLQWILDIWFMKQKYIFQTYEFSTQTRRRSHILQAPPIILPTIFSLSQFLDLEIRT